MITVTIWHNAAHDAEGRHIAMLDGYQPCDPMVAVFAYQADPAGRAPEVIADEAFAICNGHPYDAAGEELSRRYYARELRSLSFPGKRSCCPRSVASIAVTCCPVRCALGQRERSMRTIRQVGPAHTEAAAGTSASGREARSGVRSPLR